MSEANRPTTVLEEDGLRNLEQDATTCARPYRHSGESIDEYVARLAGAYYTSSDLIRQRLGWMLI